MSKLTFYHFCSEKDMLEAKRLGIIKGIVPWETTPDRDNVKRTKLNFVRLHQWLTTNKTFINLDAPSDLGPANTTLLPNRRAECRLTIVIAGENKRNLVSWVKFANANQMPLRKDIERDLINPADWWLYAGMILPSWITKVDANPHAPKPSVDLKA